MNEYAINSRVHQMILPISPILTDKVLDVLLEETLPKFCIPKNQL